MDGTKVMKKSFFAYFVITSMIFCGVFVVSVHGSSPPTPQVSASISYLDVCNPEFYVTFNISNLGGPSSTDSYFAVSVSSGLDVVSWAVIPNVADVLARVSELGDTILDNSDSPIPAKNVILEVYNHSFSSAESITVMVVFELTAYQSNYEWIKYRVAMLPEGVNYPTLTPPVRDPVISDIDDQQGYPVYELSMPINTQIVESAPPKPYHQPLTSNPEVSLELEYTPKQLLTNELLAILTGIFLTMTLIAYFLRKRK